MKINNSIKNRSCNFKYPHPLVRNIQQFAIFNGDTSSSHDVSPPIYTNYVFDQHIASQVSPKILRISNKKVHAQQKFGILIQPFNNSQNVQINYCQNLNLQCQFCDAFINFKTKSQSIYQLNCSICKQLNQVQSQLSQKKNQIGMFNDFYLGRQSDDVLQQKFISKNVCFVIQASEQNYENQIYQIITACINAVKYEEDQQNDVIYPTFSKQKLKTKLKVGFILFDNKNAYIVNQKSNNVLIFNQNFLFQDNAQQHHIIDFNSFCVPVKDITNQTFQLIKQILYEAYLIKHTCLQFVINFTQKIQNSFLNMQTFLSDRNNKQKQFIQYKFFITNITQYLKKNEGQKQKQKKQKQKQKQNSFLLKDISNKISSKIKRQGEVQKKQAKLPGSQIKLASNQQFFIVKHKLQSKQYLSKLKSQVYRIYENNHCRTQLFNQIYYDLYQNIKLQESHYDTKVKIIVPPSLNLISIGNSAIGCGNCTAIQKKQNTKGLYNEYQTVFKNIKSNSVIPVTARISQNNGIGPNKYSQNFFPIQFQFQYKINLQNNSPIKLTRVLNCEVSIFLNHSIKNTPMYTSMNNYGFVDDQTYFYFILKQVYEECQKNKTNHIITNRITQKIKQIALKFKKSYGSNLQFPKQFRHTFLYSFMILNKSFTNVFDDNFYYSRHLFMSSSMQQMVKKIYPRVYETKQAIAQNTGSQQNMQNLIIKNVKSCQNKFKANQITFFQNGVNLYLVVGQDCSVAFLKQVFGTYLVRQICHFTQLPQLETNLKYRQAIQKIRQTNQSCYLRLRVIELFSPKFQTQIGPYLYNKQNHLKHMKHLWS